MAMIRKPIQRGWSWRSSGPAACSGLLDADGAGRRPGPGPTATGPSSAPCPDLPWPSLPWPKDSQSTRSGLGQGPEWACTISVAWGPGSWSSTTTTRSSTTWSRSSASWEPNRSSTATTPSTSTGSGRRAPTPSSSRPGPGRPENSGISMAVVAELAGEFPILGVCLGHQVIGQVYGGEVVAAPTLMHGKTSSVHHDGRGHLRRPARSVRRHPLPLAGRSSPLRCPTSWRSPPRPPTG